MKSIDIAYRTLFAELVQRSLDASVQTEFSTAGNFVRVPVKGRDYWYFEETRPKTTRRYVGPADDSEIEKRVVAFKELKSDLKARRKLVSTLVCEAGLTEPENLPVMSLKLLERPGFSACGASWSAPSPSGPMPDIWALGYLLHRSGVPVLVPAP